MSAHDVPILVKLIDCQKAPGKQVAEITLNSPATLNSLTLAMIDAIAPQLAAWRNDDAIVCIVLRGAGDRAFCAGGDVQALQQAIVQNRAAGRVVDPYPDNFFEREYRLDYAIHTYPKPIVVLGHGIVMGGGLGLFGGASVRVVSEVSRIALPEITIGLFPDAGASWLLRNLPAGHAAYLGMTGANINARDALDCGWASHAVLAQDIYKLTHELSALSWSQAAQDHQRQIEEMLAPKAASIAAQLPSPQLAACEQGIERLDGASTPELMATLEQQAGRSPWIDKALATMHRGCPTSLGIVAKQLQRIQTLDLVECFQLEMIIAAQCARHADFAEGVRALLVDKDNSPQWQYKDIESLPDEHVAAHFSPPWENNPLHDLRSSD